ncbi:MAG: serine/threonine protein kinase, partial [Leptospiraceae bacterium]|nr:serine/threonine protein kinase [Leptospiraceae bacterium]
MLDRLNIAGYQLVDTVYERNDTVVCKALRSSDQVPVYLKTSPSADKAETRSRLRREFELARSLPAGLAPYLDLVETTSGPVLVLSDHSTVDLETFFSQARDLSTYLEVFSRVAAGLDAIHESGLVHRDLKPANILIEPTALRPWFIDFGIASRLQSRSETALQVGKLEGTLLYMSPEQTGRTNRKVDHRSDLYALGATFYQLLKGEPPYTSTDPLELIHSHLAKEPP